MSALINNPRCSIPKTISKKDAIRLSRILGIENELDPWAQLREQNIRKKSSINFLGSGFVHYNFYS